MFDRIDFILGEAFQALRRNPLLTIAAITTVSVALFLIGAFGYLYYRAETYAKTLPGQLEMRVYVKDGTTTSELDRLTHQLNAYKGIDHVTFLSKESAWQEMRKTHPEIPEDLANPLPDGYALNFKDVQDTLAAETSLKDTPSVERVLYQKDLLNAIKNTLGLLRYVGYFGLLLLGIGGVIIYNAIRLTILARRTEIRVMQLVGASNATVRTPFMLEGLVQGLAGGLVAALLLSLCNVALGRYTHTLGLTLPPFPSTLMLGVLGLMGAALGLLCSTVAIRLPMRST
jgi:cell division transport system permease protein